MGERESGRHINMDDLELCYMPGHIALDAFRSGELSPVDILAAQWRRYEAIGDTVNAYTEVYLDEAMERARLSESRYRSPQNNPPGALEGLTLAVKDSHDLAGKRTTHASLAYADNIADTTHPACERLIDAGAIVIGKTTTPEFGSAGVTTSKLFGATGTPWNSAFTAGGSSGGSAASLAAGLATLATGSDIAGSIRVPAACCGVVGYKPPFGRIPANSPLNVDAYFQSGPLARCVVDCALMTNVMSGIHPADIATVAERVEISTRATSIVGSRIAVSYDFGAIAITADVRAGVDRVVERLRSLGADVSVIELKPGIDINKHGAAYLDHLFGALLETELAEHADLLCEYNAYYAKQASQTDRAAFLASIDAAQRLYSVIGPIVHQFDAFVCPTVATHEVPANAMPWETIVIDGHTVDTDFGWVMSLAFNMTGRLPVLATPGGHADNGLPTGVQIVARPYEDNAVFRIGLALEKIAPTFDCAERRPQLGA